jgi:hypothetical protein
MLFVVMQQKKAAAQRVYPNKRALVFTGLYYLYKFINYSSSSSKDQHLILPHQNSIQRS